MTKLDTPTGSPHAAGQLFLVESCRNSIQANQLMDELFQDLDAYLSGQKNHRPLLKAAPAGGFSSRPTPESPPRLQRPWDSLKELSTERFLMGLGAASLMVAGLVWLSGIQRPQAELAVTPAPDQADVEFARYLSQALNRLSFQSRQGNRPGNTQIANPGLEGTTIVTQDAQGNRVERVYVPVGSNLVNDGGNPNTPPTAQAANPSAPVALTPVPPPPNSLANPQTTATKNPDASIPPSVPIPQPQNNLVGVVELGSRSLALVSVKGLAQRVAVGEILAGTPWTLSGIQGQSAVFQRGSERRTVQVGEAF